MTVIRLVSFLNKCSFSLVSFILFKFKRYSVLCQSGSGGSVMFEIVEGG